MAEPWEWEEGNLVALVENEAAESLSLDFKECAALQKTDGKKAEVSKDVSAFANSAGGTLVYGIVEDRDRHVAESLDHGYDPTEISQEWLDQIVHSNIQPRLAGVRIKAVQLTNRNPGKVAYVVHVPQSTTAHQAADKRYYKRFNFQSVPMEDYEVRDAMHRALAPRVSVLVMADGLYEGNLKFEEQSDGSYLSPSLEFSVANEPGAAVAEYLQAQIFTADTIKVPAGPGVQSATRIVLPGGYLSYHCRSHVISPGDVPLFSDEHRLVDGFQISVPSRWRGDMPLPLILWRTRSNNASANHGAVTFTKIVPGHWNFKPLPIDALPDGFSAEFAP